MILKRRSWINEGDTLREVGGGHQQVFLGVGAHTQQVVVADVSVDEGKQEALLTEEAPNLVGLRRPLASPCSAIAQTVACPLPRSATFAP